MAPSAYTIRDRPSSYRASQALMRIRSNSNQQREMLFYHMFFERN